MLRRLLRTLLVLTLVGAVLLAAVVLRSRWETGHTRLETVEHRTDQLSQELRMLQITDVHDMRPGPQRDGIVAQARELRPDLVALTGDLINSYTKDLSRIEPFVAELAALDIPLFYVPGNHEWASGLLPQVVEMLERHGVVVLRNANQRFDGPWGSLDVVGTDDYHTGVGNLEQALVGARPKAYHLVLTHSPEKLFDDLGRLDADLAVCGHTHGGQVRLPWLGALYTPGGGFLPRLDKGLFRNGAATLYIDSGVGQSTPMRLGVQSQITLHRISPS
ncbi:metallophosphoesterase [Luteococcus peritonei]|uniref:Metallophosphoesterase n=1 Tax=Luteococcus peritonei TaxID=88874 RepID=A0ABW4RU06_9ACTN